MNILGVVNDRSYGLVCYNLLRELDAKFWPLYKVEENNPNFDYSLLQDRINKPYKSDVSIRIWHQFDLAMHVGSPRIGFPIFELNNFNPAEIEQLNSQDSLLVCSHWAKNIVEQFVSCPVNVVPLGVDANVFNESYSNCRIQTNTMRFFTIGKWEIRKGHLDLLNCFNKAFNKDDDVELHMLCHNPFLKDNEWEKIYKSTLGNKVRIVPWLSKMTDLASYICDMDCGVFLSKAEGWNLGALETMACNKDLIITNYSGHTEFCTKENSRLIEMGPLEPALDGKWFFGQGEWASFGKDQEEQVIEHLRDVYKNGPKPRGLETAKHFSWSNSAKLLKNSL